MPSSLSWQQAYNSNACLCSVQHPRSCFLMLLHLYTQVFSHSFRQKLPWLTPWLDDQSDSAHQDHSTTTVNYVLHVAVATPFRSCQVLANYSTCRSTLQEQCVITVKYLQTSPHVSQHTVFFKSSVQAPSNKSTYHEMLYGTSQGLIIPCALQVLNTLSPSRKEQTARMAAFLSTTMASSMMWG